ncbi:MAG: cysteine--tRNA ligase [Victivallales bacterium]|nr:cysteine--tRNA ligase [Victivallales bacterium]
MEIKFYNSLSRRKEEFVPLTPGVAKMYTCGPTVYNFAHIGNFRAYIFEDVLRRALEYCGYRVEQVMNLTDVDDKTIRDSREAGLGLSEFTERFKRSFFEDIALLKIEKAEYYPAATDHIPEMISLIKTLMDRGYAYRADDGSVYFSIAKFANYGKLSRMDMGAQRPGERVCNDEYDKDAVADFALWKSWSESDGEVFWESPWGKGRPGWHIECSAMSMKYLGKTFDIHTGGIDNLFPHHEDEIAQSEAANGCRFVNFWLHCGYLTVEGEKMSKSLGNFYTLRDLLEKGYKAEEIRLVLLGTHYRKKLDFSFKALGQSRRTLESFAELFRRLGSVEVKVSKGLGKLLRDADEGFSKAICDDLNIAGATAVLHGLAKDVNKLLDMDKVSEEDASEVMKLFRKFDRIYGVLPLDVAPEGDSIPEDVSLLLDERRAAREQKDYAASDRIRDEIRALGWAVEDSASGQILKKLH